VILIGVLVGLYIFGKKAEKKQAEQQEQMAAAAQVVSMLIIDKKKLRLKEAGLPQMVVRQYAEVSSPYKSSGRKSKDRRKDHDSYVREQSVGVKVAYELDVNHEPMADCRINMSIVPRNSKGVSMQLDIR